MKFKKSCWVDLTTDKPVFGIRVLINGKWMNAAENSQALLFTDESVRNAKIKSLNVLLKDKV